MAGPTPVSALIHAATMVTAGVYMVARSNILYALAPTSLFIVAIIGGLTALFAATIGIAQNDIKKVLAYSTISQLGYMFLACGAGAFAAGIFHLTTHAFFKALLFLGSGSVIHAMHHHYHKIHCHDDPQDMRNMGGLKSKMPLTFWTFLIATLAIAGIPGFSGFFSKDEILWKTFASDRIWLWVIGLVTAGITAFYMFRLVYKTFYGEFRGGKNDEHIYESPYVMTIPLIILAVLSVIGGYIGIPAVIGGGNQFESFLEPVFAQGEHILVNSEIHTSSTELTLMIVSIVAAIIGIYIAFLLYRKKPEIPQNFVAKNVTLHRVVYNKYYVDEIYRAIVIVPLVKFSENLDAFFDMKIVDGSVNGIATVFRNLSAQLRKMQTGFLQNYALMMTIGIVIILGWLLLK
jgi:NADH-quinone oxidoreductase subunit L